MFPVRDSTTESQTNIFTHVLMMYYDTLFSSRFFLFRFSLFPLRKRKHNEDAKLRKNRSSKKFKQKVLASVIFKKDNIHDVAIGHYWYKCSVGLSMDDLILCFTTATSPFIGKYAKGRSCKQFYSGVGQDKLLRGRRNQ
jgi:hypothetical protein